MDENNLTDGLDIEAAVAVVASEAVASFLPRSGANDKNSTDDAT